MDNKLKSQVKEIINNSAISVENKLQSICELLQKEKSAYDWVGYYFHNEEENMLKLGPFAGEPTEHTRIPFGKGICGQVALSDETFVVPDVAAQDNYIACSLDVKSEIVVPLFVQGKNIGQIDIDSHTPNAFGDDDVHLLEFINHEVARLF